MKPQTKTAVAKIIVCALCLTGIALCGMFMYGRSVYIYYASVVALAVTAAVYCLIDAEKHTHVARTTLVIAVSLVILVVGYILFYTTGLNEKFTDFEAIKRIIQESGFWGFAVYIGLTIFQVVVLPIPAALTIVLGVAIYGPTVCFILSTIGTIIGSIIAFMLGKVFGRRLCNWMFGEENTNKYAKILGEKGRFLFIIMLIFPAFPDDMLCMIAGITSMSYGYFIVVCTLTRPIMIGVTAYLGSGVIPFSGRGIAIWVALACLMFVLFIVLTGVKKRLENRRGQKKKG